MPASWAGGASIWACRPACWGNRRGKPAAVEATLHHNDAVDLEHRHPQAVAGRDRLVAVNIHAGRDEAESGQQVLGLVTEMAATAGVEEGRHWNR